MLIEDIIYKQLLHKNVLCGVNDDKKILNSS